MILRQFTSYVLVCQTNNFIIYNTHLTDDGYVYALEAEKTKWLIKHTATTTKIKIDHTKRQLLTHRAPPDPPKPDD